LAPWDGDHPASSSRPVCAPDTKNALNASRAEADEWKPLAGWNILATSAATAAVRNRARLRYIRAAREALDRAEELLR
jgi:hypothetical protein